MLEFITRKRTRISQLLGVLYVLFFMFSEKKLGRGFTMIAGTMFAAGCVLVGAATVGRLWCAQYISGYQDDVLITDGPYSVCRNPLYFFSFLGGIGVGLCTGSVVLAVTIAAVFVGLYPIVIRSEERKLSDKFGKQYDQYAAKVPRFFPDISLFREPAEYVVNTRSFRREIIDAIYFIWLVGLFEFVGKLIDRGILPTFIALY
jgi:protein-S-isoprenylcysteine O-methyltransferase Ste14